MMFTVRPLGSCPFLYFGSNTQLNLLHDALCDLQIGLFLSGGEARILGSVTHNGAAPSMLTVMSSFTEGMMPCTVPFHPR